MSAFSRKGKARQTCLAALTYDRAAASVSSDDVTHGALVKQPPGNEPAAAETYTNTHIDVPSVL